MELKVMNSKEGQMNSNKGQWFAIALAFLIKMFSEVGQAKVNGGWF
jgi:hypothetical protein